MAKVLAKAEKYINGDEALLSKWETLPHKRRKAGVRKSESGDSEDEETERDPHEGIERTESDLQRDEATLGTA